MPTYTIKTTNDDILIIEATKYYYNIQSNSYKFYGKQEDIILEIPYDQTQYITLNTTNTEIKYI